MLIFFNFTIFSFSNNVRLQIKTFAMEGMIWFVGDFLDTSKETSSPDYSAIYLDKGKVVYKCNLGKEYV